MPNSLEFNGQIAGGILGRAGGLLNLAVSVTCPLGPLAAYSLKGKASEQLS